eukprot:7313189-Prymnesium_polylepis.1
MPPSVKTCSGASLTPFWKNARLVSRVIWAMVSTLMRVAPKGGFARPLEAMCAARSAVVDSSRSVVTMSTGIMLTVLPGLKQLAAGLVASGAVLPLSN